MTGVKAIKSRSDWPRSAFTPAPNGVIGFDVRSKGPPVDFIGRIQWANAELGEYLQEDDPLCRITCARLLADALNRGVGPY